MGNILLNNDNPRFFGALRNNRKPETDIRQNLKNFAYGFTDENLAAMVVKDILNYSMHENPQLKYDEEYDIFKDPQIRGLEQYIGNFLHSRNKIHTKQMIDNFLSGADSYKGSPAYITGRILGGLTDPSTILGFTKAGNFLLQGSRIARGIKTGSVVAGEELLKRSYNPDRSYLESGLITAAGFTLPALLPAIPSKLGRNFDRNSDFLDEADEIFTNQSAGAAQTRRQFDDLKARYEDLNKIDPTGLGIFGENSRTTPIFRTLQNGTAEAQEMIEDIFEIPLIQKKNIEGFKTQTSIERNIKARQLEFVEAEARVMDAYDKYLQYHGRAGRGEIEKLSGLTFSRKNIVSQREWREMVTERMITNKPLEKLNKVENDLLKEAAEANRSFYDKIVREYEEFDVVGSFLQTNIERLKFFEKRMRQKKAPSESDLEQLAGIVKEIQKLENRLKIARTQGIRRKDYVNIVFKRDELDNRFEEFTRIMRDILLRSGNPQFKNLTEEEVMAIINGYKAYQPVVRFEDVNSLINRQIPDLETIETITSRFYGRNFDLGTDAYIRLMNAGFIERDIAYLNKLYFNQTVPDLEVTKVFGDPMGMGVMFNKGKGKKGILQISEDFDFRLNNLEKDSPEYIKLEKQRTQVLEDLHAAIELNRGTYGLHKDPNRSMSRVYRFAKLANAMSMLTGISQIVDIARLVTTNGILKTMGIQWDMFTSGMAKEIFKMNKRTMNLGGEALDLATSSTAMRMYDIDDAHGVFGKFEKAHSQLGNIYFTFFNLANPWNTLVKTQSGLFNTTRAIESIEKYLQTGKISKVNKARLANMGIDITEGDDMAKRIYEQYQLYGYGKNGGRQFGVAGENNKKVPKFKYLRVANSDEWTDREAADVFQKGLAKQANIDIVTPGKGDVPLWTNSEIGGLIAQFKKWGFAATQRVMMRGLQERDAKQLQGVFVLMMAGAGLDAFRGEQTGGISYEKKKTGAKLVDAFDRSGLGGIFSDINNSLERVTNNNIGLRPLLGAKKPYGTYKSLFKNPVPDLLGPSASQIARIGDIMYSWGTGTYNHHDAKNVRRLIPFNNVWFLDGAFDSLEKGLR